MNSSIKKAIYLIFSILFSCSINSGVAQSFTIEDVSPNHFNGVHEIENIGFYTLYSNEKTIGKMKNFTLQLLDFEYKKINEVNLLLSKEAFEGGSIANKEAILTYFFDPARGEIKLITLTNKGEKIAERAIACDKDILWLERENQTIKIFGNTNGFFLLRPFVEEKKGGIELIKFNSKLEEEWVCKIHDKDIHYSYSQAIIYEHNLYIICETRTKIAEQSTIGVISISDYDGSQNYQYNFSENVILVPSNIKSESGRLIVSGTYFTREHIFKPAGIFTLILNENGKKEKFDTISWENVISPDIKKLKNSNKLNIKDSPHILIHSIERTLDGYQLIGETFNKKIGLGVSFEFSDFLIINYDNEFKYNGISVITKPINIIGAPFQWSIVPTIALIPFFKEIGVLNYQFVAKAAEENYGNLVYTIREGSNDKIRIGISSLDPKIFKENTYLKDSETSIIKGIEKFGILKTNSKKVIAYVYKKKRIMFYDVFFLQT